MKSPLDAHRLAMALGLALSLVLVSAPILAQHPRHGDHGPGNPGMHMERMLRQLDLSEMQQTEIHELVATHRQATRGRLDQVRSAKLALFDQVHAVDFDEAAIREAAAAVATAEAEVSVARAALLQGIRQILTPDQQAEAQRMIERHRAAMEEGPGSLRSHGPLHGHGSSHGLRSDRDAPGGD